VNRGDRRSRQRGVPGSVRSRRPEGGEVRFVPNLVRDALPSKVRSECLRHRRERGYRRCRESRGIGAGVDVVEVVENEVQAHRALRERIDEGVHRREIVGACGALHAAPHEVHPHCRKTGGLRDVEPAIVARKVHVHGEPAREVGRAGRRRKECGRRIHRRRDGIEDAHVVDVDGARGPRFDRICREDGEGHDGLVHHAVIRAAIVARRRVELDDLAVEAPGVAPLERTARVVLQSLPARVGHTELYRHPRRRLRPEPDRRCRERRRERERRAHVVSTAGEIVREVRPLARAPSPRPEGAGRPRKLRSIREDPRRR